MLQMFEKRYADVEFNDTISAVANSVELQRYFSM